MREEKTKKNHRHFPCFSSLLPRFSLTWRDVRASAGKAVTASPSGASSAVTARRVPERPACPSPRSSAVSVQSGASLPPASGMAAAGESMGGESGESGEAGVAAARDASCAAVVVGVSGASRWRTVRTRRHTASPPCRHGDTVRPRWLVAYKRGEKDERREKEKKAE